MKLAVINSVDYGSTGRLALAIAHAFVCQGNTAKVFVFNKTKEDDLITPIHLGKIDNFIHHAWSRIDGKDGFHYHKVTRYLISLLETYQPDVVHLHNLHGYYLNVPMLLHYLAKKKVKIVWTLHDFWTLTGRCAVPQDCTRFLSVCQHCPHKDNYPYAIFHLEKSMHQQKKSLFSSLKNTTFVTPSDFLGNYARQTVLNQQNIITIHNGINLNVFHRKETDLKARLGIPEEKKVLLDVAFPFSGHKGISYLNELADQLSEDYQLVLVGPLDHGSVHKKIIHIDRVSQEELVGYYSAADLLVNPTISDNYPTVDMEAISCLTPVVTFDTGGSKEIVTPEVGAIVQEHSVQALMKAVESLIRNPVSKDKLEKKRQEFDENKMLEHYVEVLGGVDGKSE